MEIQPTPQSRTGFAARAGRLTVNALCLAVSLIGIAFILPAAFGLERYVIAGGSMTGSISRGSVVFEEVVPVSDLRLGDVITYMPPADAGIDNLVTHRIVAIDGDTFRTQGDANADRDPWTFRLTGATQARVVQHVPAVGYVFLALQNRDTRMLVIGVPAGLVALVSLTQLFGAVRRRPEHESSQTAGVSAAAADASTGSHVVPVPDQRGSAGFGHGLIRPTSTPDHTPDHSTARKG